MPCKISAELLMFGTNSNLCLVRDWRKPAPKRVKCVWPYFQTPTCTLKTPENSLHSWSRNRRFVLCPCSVWLWVNAIENVRDAAPM